MIALVHGDATDWPNHALMTLGSPDPEVRAHVKKLCAFARWAATGLYRAVPWEAYDVRVKRARA